VRKMWPEDMWTGAGSIRDAMGTSRPGRTLRTVETYKCGGRGVSAPVWPLPPPLSSPGIIPVARPINGSVDGTGQFKPPSGYCAAPLCLLCLHTPEISLYIYITAGDSIHAT